MMGATVSKISYYLPKEIVSNLDLEKMFPEWDATNIEKKVGIVQRHIAAVDETAADMAVKAAESLFETYERAKVDFVLFCTQSPDYKLPTSSCSIQTRLGLRSDIGAIDYNLGCSGYIYGLSLAKGLVAAGVAKNILLLTGETYSKYMHKDDKGNRSIFGDAATATIVEETDSEKIGKFVLGTDGTGADKLIVKQGGSKFPFTQEDNLDKWISMDGPEIFNFTIKKVPPVFKEVLEKNGLDIASVDYVIFHQANAFMLNFLRKMSGIPKEKFYLNMRNTGNTVSNTIPVALTDCLKNGLIKSGDKVALVGFGVGLSWAGTVIEIK